MTASSSQFDTLQLLQAYERAIDQNIISSITDTTGRILYVNQRFCDTSQYSAAELVGQNHRIVNSGHHPAEFFRNMWRTISAGNVWHDEIRNRAKDGTRYWVDTVIVPIKGSSGENTHYLSLRTLITEKKKLEHDRAEAHRALKVLLVMTSDKVRRPLSHCLAQMNRLDADAQLTPTAITAILKDLRSSASELDTFTRELATFIRDMEMNLVQEN
jgi:PAS domain S-box-containing protein